MATATETKTDLSIIEKFLAQRDFELRLTFAFLPAPIVIPAVLILDDDAKAARQKFYAQPEQDQAAGVHAYHVEMLKHIVAGRPSGLPGFETLLPDDFVGIDHVREAIGKYFSAETDLSKMLAATIVDQYVRAVTPAEFFR